MSDQQESGTPELTEEDRLLISKASSFSGLLSGRSQAILPRDSTEAPASSQFATTEAAVASSTGHDSRTSSGHTLVLGRSESPQRGSHTKGYRTAPYNPHRDSPAFSKSKNGLLTISFQDSGRTVHGPKEITVLASRIDRWKNDFQRKIGRLVQASTILFAEEYPDRLEDDPLRPAWGSVQYEYTSKNQGDKMTLKRGLIHPSMMPEMEDIYDDVSQLGNKNSIGKAISAGNGVSKKNQYMDRGAGRSGGIISQRGESVVGECDTALNLSGGVTPTTISDDHSTSSMGSPEGLFSQAASHLGTPRPEP